MGPTSMRISALIRDGPGGPDALRICAVDLHAYPMAVASYGCVLSDLKDIDERESHRRFESVLHGWSVLVPLPVSPATSGMQAPYRVHLPPVKRPRYAAAAPLRLTGYGSRLIPLGISPMMLSALFSRAPEQAGRAVDLWSVAPTWLREFPEQIPEQ